jgi:hypothetical protein
MGKKLCPNPPADANIFDAGEGWLVVTEKVFQRVTVNRWTRLSFDKLPVLDPPKDGLPVLLGD